ncbi:MAG: HAD family hydrolase [Ruminococcaceae bacterium]|jgi:phosphoglycolate phosphatase|nr:HAD family hydrolase [Oscillospiraceae bacterium]
MGRKFDFAFFDFDGTIADTKEGIFNCLKYAFTEVGLPVPPDSELYKMIGPPLSEGFEDVFGFKGSEVDLMIEKYRERYRAGGMFECTPYEGIENTLRTLKENGVSLSVASSKPLPFATKLLEKFDLVKYFNFLSCPLMDKVHMTKTDIVNQALEKNNITDKSRAVMVGDRFYDIVGAKETGVEVIAVLYGFGDEDEFRKYGADYIAKTPEEVTKIILGE